MSVDDSIFNKATGFQLTGRLLVVSLIMLDSLRRLLGPASRFDIVMLLVELLVLILILIEVSFSMKDRFVSWRSRKTNRKVLGQNLDSLTPEELSNLRRLVTSKNQVMSSDWLELNRRVPGLIVQSFAGLASIAPEHKALVEKWLAKK